MKPAALALAVAATASPALAQQAPVAPLHEAMPFSLNERQPGAFWDGNSDPDRSLTHYPAQKGFERPCIFAGRPTTEPMLAQACDAVWETYQRRGNYMIGAQLPTASQAERDELCAAMAHLLAPHFTHLQAPKALLPNGKGGFTFTGKAALVAGCRTGKMFDVTGFKAFTAWVMVEGPNRGTSVTCYIQNQVGGANSPTGDFFPDGRPVTYRLAIEEVSRSGPGAQWETDRHVAVDVPKTAVFESCAVPGPR